MACDRRSAEPIAKKPGEDDGAEETKKGKKADKWSFLLDKTAEAKKKSAEEHQKCQVEREGIKIRVAKVVKTKFVNFHYE